jgi:hypothetical protein
MAVATSPGKQAGSPSSIDMVTCYSFRSCASVFSLDAMTPVSGFLHERLFSPPKEGEVTRTGVLFSPPNDGEGQLCCFLRQRHRQCGAPTGPARDCFGFWGENAGLETRAPRTVR